MERSLPTKGAKPTLGRGEVTCNEDMLIALRSFQAGAPT